MTTDPARDDGPAVADYAEAFDPCFIGVTGDLDDIIEVGRSVGVGVEQGEKLPSGGYEVTHGTQVAGDRRLRRGTRSTGVPDVSQAQLDPRRPAPARRRMIAPCLPW